MYYDIKVRHTALTKKGEEKQITERFVCENCETFAEAEYKGLKLFKDADVLAVSISPVREVVNAVSDNAIYMATIEDIFINDMGEEKTTKYKVLLFAPDTTKANSIINDYIKQGLNDMTCTEIKKTNIKEIV